MKNASPIGLALRLVSPEAAYKQHSSIAAQQAIRSPQQSVAANAAPPKANSNAAAVRVSFIVFLLDEFDFASDVSSKGARRTKIRLGKQPDAG